MNRRGLAAGRGRGKPARLTRGPEPAISRAVRRFLSIIPLCLALAGCGGSETGPVKSASVAVPRPAVRPGVRQPVRRAPPPAHVLALPGLEGVIGATPGDLARQFGTPRLDVWEGDARKVQYSGAACVLDIYLYPAAPGREPQATYVDARRGSDGQDVDRAACIAALRRGGAAPGRVTPP